MKVIFARKRPSTTGAAFIEIEVDARDPAEAERKAWEEISRRYAPRIAANLFKITERRAA